MPNISANFQISNSIEKGVVFLKRKIVEGKYGLKCIGDDNSLKFSNQKGHLFSIFYILNALNEELSEVERTIFIARILSEMAEDNTWGYSPRGYYDSSRENNPYFTDADDTAFALRSLRKLGIYKKNDVLNNFLVRFVPGISYTNAYVTFNKKILFPKIVSVNNGLNNFQIHPEVNANVFHALLDSANSKWINYRVIQSCQNDLGYWYSYFYPNVYYSTFHFMSLLRSLNKSNSIEYNKGKDFLIKSMQSNFSWGINGDPYSTALALMALGADFDLLNVKKNLCKMQNDDGSWTTNEIIWKFCESKNDSWISYDDNNIICTSLVISALKMGLY